MATKPSPQFTPVPVRRRHDGWTPERQVAFIEALAQCGCVDEACDRVGMGRSSAYELRERDNADSFRAAWEAALDQRRPDVARRNAIDGDPSLRGLKRHRLREARDSVLRGDVGALVGRGDKAVRARRIDDPAPSLRLHSRDCEPCRVECRGEVDSDDRVPFLRREILDR